MIDIPHYKITETIFTSTGTRVFRAQDEDTECSVILRTCGAVGDSTAMESRMSFSFEVLEKFNHPNIVKAIKFIPGSPLPCLVMEDSGSIDLRRYVEQFEDKQLPVQSFLDIAIQLADALDVIHYAQVIHKDLHPGNIIINPDTGRVQIIDFGLASLLTREQPAVVEPDRLEGVLSYISPEQTGRMNRALDYRSDFYTLGVTFYQLLTGSLPFEAGDALGMVYAHMASEQESAAKKRPGIPNAIASIIDKMMMKNAEDRYQSAYGLKYDLQQCQKDLRKNGAIGDFLLATEDISSRFSIPQTLYGRQEEIQTLLQSFDRALTGTPQLLTVAGYSGIGKSALVHEIYKPIAANNGVFVSGKFYQFQQNTPYSAFKSALATWLKQELRLSEANLLSQKKRIGEALGNNASVLIEFMPEFELLLGAHEPPIKLGSQETLTRFILVIQAFLKTVTEHRPWVLFIDDIQWADRGTLQLLPSLLNETDTRLLLLLAYRDNEVDEQHSAQLMINRIESSGASVGHIKLAPLKEQHIRLLITDTFHRTQTDVEALAQLVIAKTGGNPFFAIEFLKALYRKSLVSFDINEHCWSWKLSEIQKESITDNVVDLMLERMSELPKDTQNLMQIASCVGTRFDLDTLSVASGLDMAEVSNSLWQALKDGLLVQEGGDWFLGMMGAEVKSPQMNTSLPEYARRSERALQSISVVSNETAIQSFIPQCKFIHDRMLQAAYESLGEQDRIQTHLDIGRRLYGSFSIQQRKERVFELVEQLNHGAALIDNNDEKRSLVELNTLAAEKAKRSSVWQAAEGYSSLALELMGGGAWESDYELCFRLHCIKAESVYLSGEFGRASECYDVLVEKAKDPLDKAELLTQQLVQSIGRSDYANGLKYGRKALSVLGINIPEEPDEIHKLIVEQQKLLDKALAACPISSIHNLPECTDRASQLANYLLVNFGMAGMLIQKQELVVVGVQKGLLITLAHGRTDSTLVTLTSYGMLLAGRDEFEAAAEVGEKAKELLEIYPNCREAASVCNGLAVALNHLKGPLMDSYFAYERGFEAGLQAGELARAGVCTAAKASIKAVAGYPLEETLSEAREAIVFTEKKSLRIPFLPIYDAVWSSYLTNSYLIGDEQFSTEELNAITNTSFKFALFYFRFEFHLWSESDCGVLLSHLYDACETYKYFKFHFMAVDLYCYANLAFIRCQREGYFEGREEEFEKLQIIANEYFRVLKKRSALNPKDCRHKESLVRAESLALEGAPFEQVAPLYKQAITEAEDNGFRQYAALTNECFGRYLSDIGFESLSEVPLRKAFSWYKSWGNKIKVDSFKERYLFLNETPIVSSSSTSITRQETIAESELRSKTTHATITSIKGSGALDFQSIVKSMQAISGELDLHNLIKSMMNVIMENAGAQIAVLVMQTHKGPEIEAQIDLGNNKSSFLQHIPLEEAQQIPKEMINLTLRVGERVWLDNACEEGEFVQDSYVIEARSKSILCLPISYRNSRIGVLYLENNLSAGAFTEGRLNVLEVLLGQASISLENARLFNEVTGLNAGLEAKVAQRTQDLDLANVELAAANKELESFSYTVSHDLKSPLRMIKGFSDILVEDYQDQLDEEAKGILGKVIAGAKSMEELINGLLDLSRMQRKEVKREPINLSDIANTVVSNLRDTYPDRDVEITIQEGMKVSGDARMMHSVVENLINNAWKYSGKTDSAKIKFCETVRYDDHGRSQRVFEVSDNGAGFDMDHADKLFSTFQRLHNKKDFDGTGVGLSTVKRIIEKHNGEIWAEAKVNKGASFYFTIG